MNSVNDLKEYKKAYKSLYNRGIYAYKLQIIDELECLLEEELKEEDYLKLFNAIENAYLKSDILSVWTITRCAVEYIRRILDDDETFNLRDRACWYE